MVVVEAGQQRATLAADDVVRSAYGGAGRHDVRDDAVLDPHAHA